MFWGLNWLQSEGTVAVSSMVFYERDSYLAKVLEAVLWITSADSRDMVSFAPKDYAAKLHPLQVFLPLRG